MCDCMQLMPAWHELPGAERPPPALSMRDIKSRSGSVMIFYEYKAMPNGSGSSIRDSHIFAVRSRPESLKLLTAEETAVCALPIEVK